MQTIYGKQQVHCMQHQSPAPISSTYFYWRSILQMLYYTVSRFQLVIGHGNVLNLEKGRSSTHKEPANPSLLCKRTVWSTGNINIIRDRYRCIIIKNSNIQQILEPHNSSAEDTCHCLKMNQIAAILILVLSNAQR